MQKIYLVLFLFCFNSHSLLSQKQRVEDSLLAVLSQTTNDTAKTDILFQLAKNLGFNDPPKAQDYANQILSISEKIGFKRGIANGYTLLGRLEHRKGDYIKALDYQQKALKIREEIGNKGLILSTHSMLGNIYLSIGRMTEAINSFYVMLKIGEETRDTPSIAMAYNNLSIIYNDQKKYDEALNVLTKALKLNETNPNKSAMALQYGNIANVYYNQKNLTAALNNYWITLKLFKESEDDWGIAVANDNIGSIYKEMGNESEALKYYFEALKHYELVNYESDIANVCAAIGNIYSHQKQFAQADKYIKRGVQLATKTGDILALKGVYEHLSELDSLRGNYKESLKNYKTYIFYRDSISNSDISEKALKSSMEYDFEKKETALKHEQQLTAEQLKQQKTLTTALIIGLIALILAAVLYYQRQKQKELKRKAAIQAEFTQQLLENIEEERGRIAIDLHDSISHELLSLKRGIKPQNTEGVPERIDKIIDDIRQISRNLHPVLLDKIGLKMSIETLCEQYAEHETLFISHDIDYPKPLPKPAELQVFRIIQEALNNTVKYANANASSIRMSENTEGGIFLEIKDNGKGFDVEKALDSGKSFGLHSIVQRSKAIGGTAVIQSSEGGTVIKIIIPNM